MSYFVFEEARLLQTSAFRNDHDLVLDSLTNKAFVHAKKHEHAKALEILQRVSRSQKTKFGVESKEYIETVGVMGYFHIKLWNIHEGLKCLEQAERWQEEQEGWVSTDGDTCHPCLMKTKESIAKIHDYKRGKGSFCVNDK